MGTDFDNEPSNRYIGISAEPCHPTNILWTDDPWRGRVLYTGPDGNCDHRVTVEPEYRYVGIGTMSREGTSEVDYLWRAAPSTPFHRPKTSKVGEVGWAVPEYQDWSYPNTSRQIMSQSSQFESMFNTISTSVPCAARTACAKSKYSYDTDNPDDLGVSGSYLGHFRQEVEDRHSHKYQNAWYPGPRDNIDPNSDAALMMNVYQPRSRTADPRLRTQASRNARGSTSTDSSEPKPGERTQQYLNK